MRVLIIYINLVPLPVFWCALITSGPLAMDGATNSTSIQLTWHFLKVGKEILGLDTNHRVTTVVQHFRNNFKYGPRRCAFIFLKTRFLPMIPDGYEPKHLLWTLYFLLTYTTERRMCCVLRADRKTIRKFTWPIISAIASLSTKYVRIKSSNHCL